MKKRVLFIASAGGHLSELMSLKSMMKDYDSFLMTEKTKSSEALLNEYRKKMGFLLYGTMAHPFRYPFKLLGNCFISLYYYLKFRPQVVITTGVHSAGPMCCIAKIMGSKVIYIESFANIETKTASGRIIYYFADLFVVQWKSMQKLYPKAKFGGWIY
ncbi:MAG: polysaccharide biosynthesis protein [Bacilli bacterium]|jgi:UDP-N-acetylglucosamine:LPS N-acetylglucosamine transferase|nr:polysaccharide biosynthesis protein [Bacilli bacterium]